MDEIPKQLAWPIRLNPAGTDFVYLDQDSPEEHQAAAALILSVPVGSLIDAPELGVPDATFRAGGADVAAYKAALQRFEPRISEEIAAGAIVDRVQQVDVEVAAA